MSDDTPKRRGRRGRRRQIEDDDSDEDSKKEETKQSSGDGDGDEESQSAGRRGRRGRRGNRRRIEDDDDDDDDDDNDNGGDDDDDDRNTGWGGSSKGKRDRDSSKHKTAANWDDEAEGNDTIMVIPTLSSEDEEDVKGPDKDAIAQAPQASTMLPRTHELDEDIKSILPTATASGIDLSILTSCLVPQNLILEEDEEWKFDELLQEVAIELQEEAEDKHHLLTHRPGDAGYEDDPNDF
mmetsp:Transcript_24277/g.35478  ORF Transcript_24277/g.35478 Transcript_24277/m.35478 type:complete len:238 (-) Transcript_24277:66-779(-)